MAGVVSSWLGCFYGGFCEQLVGMFFYGGCCEQLAGMFFMTGVVSSWLGCFLWRVL